MRYNNQINISTFASANSLMYFSGFKNTPNEIANKISSFRNLPVGWRYGLGGPISPSIISSALAWNDFLRSLNFLGIDAFAGAGGEILIAGEAAEYYIEVILEVDNTISLVCDINDKQELYLEHQSPSLVVESVSEIARKIWTASTYYIQTISTQDASALPAWRSRIQPGEVFLSSTLSASDRLEIQSALTPEDFTRMYQASPQFSGGLTHPYFQRLTA